MKTEGKNFVILLQSTEKCVIIFNCMDGRPDAPSQAPGRDTDTRSFGGGENFAEYQISEKARKGHQNKDSSQQDVPFGAEDHSKKV